MKSALLGFVIAGLILPSFAVAAGISDAAGTWSGNWTPKGGVLDSVTVEIHVDNAKLSGKFRTPVSMDFSKISYDPKTSIVSFEATDSKTNKHYKLDGKLNGNEIKGTLVAGDVTGDVLLIKWTYVPR
jgi:hypothetical protein